MANNNFFRFGILCFFLLSLSICKAQLFDSLDVRAGLEARFSSRNYQPFWLISNRFGTVADRRNDLSPFLRISNSHILIDHESTNTIGLYEFDGVNLSYGLSMYVNNHFKSLILEEGYAKVEYGNWSLQAGRFEETTGDLDPQLSTGSLGISGNALPIPKIGIAVTRYTDFPFTRGWVQFKGSFAHGWMGRDRYIRNTFYHEKTFFLRVGAGNLKFSAGIEHFAEWGGTKDEEDQQFDRSMKGFWDIFFLKENTEVNTGGAPKPFDGDHRGVIEGGVFWENDAIALHGYLQKPFEGRGDISLRNTNMLAGFMVSMKGRYRGLQKILFEFISTKDINEHIPPERRESYYNNSVYKTGWEYRDNIIGTPLFTNRSRASKYFGELKPFQWGSRGDGIPGNANIVNNRITGVHLGALYSFTDELSGKTMLTYTKNYGSSADGVLFAPHKKQFYGLQQIIYDIPERNLSIKAGVGFDVGQLVKSPLAGGLLGIVWHVMGDKNGGVSSW